MHLSHQQLNDALTMRDLTDAAYGPHCLQLLVAEALQALSSAWGVGVSVHRGARVVSVADNYDRLGYPADGAARDARYTRYVDDQRLLRTQTSAAISGALRELGPAPDTLIAVPGLVWRRDVIDRLHVGAPHQLDLWRIAPKKLDENDLQQMIALVCEALVPGRPWRTLDAEHPYTNAGQEVQVLIDDEWIELLECGLAAEHVLRSAGLTASSGLAMGIGLDRAAMLRKNISDIRLLRSDDPRVAEQMLDLRSYEPVSNQPAANRDLSLVCAPGADDEQLGDRVRSALEADSECVECVQVLSRTPVSSLPAAAWERMGATAGQENLLVRLVLRHPTRSLAKAEANALRNRVYESLHEGQRSEYA